MDLVILLLILIPLGTAFLIPLVDLIYKKMRKYLVFLAGTLELVVGGKILFENYSTVAQGDFFLHYNLGGWLAPFGITLIMDSLSLVFSLLITFSLFFIILYSIGFIGHHEGKYYVLLFLVLAAMQGAILTGDIFNLYVFIELLAVTTAPLIAFKQNQNSTEAAIKYLFYGIIGGLFFFIGVILVYFSVGSLNIAEIAANFNQVGQRMQLFIISMFLMSFLIKLGIFPFHFWLPKAHSACPSSISALLSGVLLKVYIYIFLRILWIGLDFSLIESIHINDFIIYLALFSSLLGHIFALQADDIKRMLAFSTIGHIGMIVGVIALNTTAGFYGGLLHIIAHLLMKSGLFLGTGILLQYTTSHNIKDLIGVAYENRLLFVSFIIFSLGMIGIPPLIGFMSKWYILLAFLQAQNHFGAILVVLGSLTAVVYYIRYISKGYETVKVSDEEPDRDTMINPIIAVFYRKRIVLSIVYIFTILVLVSGIFFKVFNVPINAAIDELINPRNYIKLVLGG